MAGPKKGKKVPAPKAAPKAGDKPGTTKVAPRRVAESAPSKPPRKRDRRNRPPALPPDPPEGPPPVPVGPEEQPLDDEERRFVDEWLYDRNGPAAVRRMHPEFDHRSCRRTAAQYEARPHVAFEMRAARHAQRVRCRVSADMALEELCRLAFSDVAELFDPASGLLRMPRHIPLPVRRAVAKVRVTRERRTEITDQNSRTIVADTVIEYSFWNKADALGRLFEHLGLKTPLPPLQALLAALPQPLAAQLQPYLMPQLPPGAPKP